jgi:hypothetical protein
MDLVLAGTDTQLLESLDFSLKPTANYVQSRFLTAHIQQEPLHSPTMAFEQAGLP